MVKTTENTLICDRFDKLDGNIKQLCSTTTDINIKVVRIEEHLKNMNGSIARHEKEIDELEKGQVQTKIDIAKQIGWGGLGGTVFFILMKLIFKF